MYIENNNCICEGCPWREYCYINVSKECTRKMPLTEREPSLAKAIMGGSGIHGIVTFKDVPGGTEVKAVIDGLPDYQPATASHPQIGPHGFHIHSAGKCETGNPDDTYKSAGGHFNPTNQRHGNHAGDFPVLFSNKGRAEMTFFTDKFKVRDIIGKSVIIHESPDDYRTQPAGNSGKRIACGVIMAGI